MVKQLQQVNPDKWKNIPYPLIESIKLLITCQQQQFYKMSNQVSQHEENKKKSQVQFQRFDRELNKREEKFDSFIDRLEKNMSQAYNKLRIEVENNIQKHDIKIEQEQSELKKVVSELKIQLQKVEDPQILRDWTQDKITQIEQTTNNNIQANSASLQSQIDEIINKHLQAPGFIGEKEQNKSLVQFIQNKFPNFEQQLEELKKQVEKEDQQFTNLSQQYNNYVTNQIPQELDKLNKEFEQLQEYCKDLEQTTINDYIPKLQEQFNEVQQQNEKLQVQIQEKLEQQENQLNQQNEQLQQFTTSFNQMKQNLQFQGSSRSLINKTSKQNHNTEEIQRLLEQQQTDFNKKLMQMTKFAEKQEQKIQFKLQQVDSNSHGSKEQKLNQDQDQIATTKQNLEEIFKSKQFQALQHKTKQNSEQIKDCQNILLGFYSLIDNQKINQEKQKDQQTQIKDIKSIITSPTFKEEYWNQLETFIYRQTYNIFSSIALHKENKDLQKDLESDILQGIDQSILSILKHQKFNDHNNYEKLSQSVDCRDPKKDSIIEKEEIELNSSQKNINNTDMKIVEESNLDTSALSSSHIVMDQKYFKDKKKSVDKRQNDGRLPEISLFQQPQVKVKLGTAQNSETTTPKPKPISVKYEKLKEFDKQFKKQIKRSKATINSDEQ